MFEWLFGGYSRPYRRRNRSKWACIKARRRARARARARARRRAYLRRISRRRGYRRRW